MNMRITVYYDTMDLWGNRLRTRTLEVGKELPKNCYYSEEEALTSYNEKLSIKKADYEKNRPLALAKLNKLEMDIKALLTSSDCELYYTYEGDSHGISSERMEISTTLNGHDYIKEITL